MKEYRRLIYWPARTLGSLIVDLTSLHLSLWLWKRGVGEHLLRRWGLLVLM